MYSLLYSLHIGTLATWLSVVGFGAVGIVVHGRNPAPVRPEISETQLISEDFTLGADSLPDSGEPQSEAANPTPADPLPAPPELSASAEIEPLPVIPDLMPQPEQATEAPVKAKTSARVKPVGRSAGKSSGTAAPATRNGAGNPGSGAAGMSNSARLAAGRMPSPNYPPYSRRHSQTGTVVVEFTVDASGRVISAFAKSPSPWPLLNAEAVSTVRSWRFPPGGVMKLQRPIVFQLR